MSGRWLLAVVAAAMICVAWILWPGAVTRSQGGLIREHVALRVDLPGIWPTRLEAIITRPAGASHLPIVILTHGLPLNRFMLGDVGPSHLSGFAAELAHRGYGVVAVARRGYGTSSGRAGDVGRCGAIDFYGTARASGRELVAAAEAVRGLPWADGGRIIMAGNSAGGLAALGAASLRPPGLVGVINLSGGLGNARVACGSEDLVRAVGALGMTTDAPSLWLYAANDELFPPELARAMRSSHVLGGSRSVLPDIPPIGRDGHSFALGEPPEQWWGHVGDFLASLGLPGDASLRPLAAVPASPAGLNTAHRADWERYWRSLNHEKAFVTGDRGAFAWSEGHRTIRDAETAALERCRFRSSGCRVAASGTDGRR